MQQIVDFILELDKLKGVTRKTRPLGLERYENSAEHSWQIALLAASMAQYADAPVDTDRVVTMLLVHDIGDALTVSGCPILWPIPIRRKRWYPLGTPKPMRFKAGSWVEVKVLMPAFMVLGIVEGVAALNVG